jgi:hypothetical protein
MGLGKKCDGGKMPGRKDPSSGKNKFQILSFFAHPFFCPSLKTECQLKGELNPKGHWREGFLASSYRRDRNSSRVER